ncbi:MAG: DUF192 domain-containing protein [Pseudomonadota bacterium]
MMTGTGARDGQRTGPPRQRGGPGRRLGVALAALLATAQAPLAVEAAPRGCAIDRVTIISMGQVSYTVELALTPEEQARGLMFRQSMPADAGMLFVFDTPRQASFWMKNTFIPLDIIFVDGEGRVLNVAANTVPFSEASVLSEGIASAVLEVNAGQARKHGITRGSQLVHPAFRAAPEGHRCPPMAPFED